jgi:phage-related protein
MVDILRQCQKEIGEFPEEMRGDIADAAARLNQGLVLSMPLSRPMPGIGPGVHELRFRDRSGIYRIIYAILGKRGVWFLHAFHKKTGKTPPQNIEIAKRRLKEVP